MTYAIDLNGCYFTAFNKKKIVTAFSLAGAKLFIYKPECIDVFNQLMELGHKPVMVALQPFPVSEAL